MARERTDLTVRKGKIAGAKKYHNKQLNMSHLTSFLARRALSWSSFPPQSCCQLKTFFFVYSEMPKPFPLVPLGTVLFFLTLTELMTFFFLIIITFYTPDCGWTKAPPPAAICSLSSHLIFSALFKTPISYRCLLCLYSICVVLKLMRMSRLSFKTTCAHIALVASSRDLPLHLKREVGLPVTSLPKTAGTKPGQPLHGAARFHCWLVNSLLQ